VTPQLVIRDDHGPSDRAAHKLAAKLALHGADISGTSGFYSKWKPYCDAPVPVVARSSPRSSLKTVEAGLLAPCRKCEKCRLFRRMRWRQRIINEVVATDDAGRRSWFVTITFSPIHLAGISMRAAALAAKSGKPHSEAVERCAYDDVQRFHKRLRKRLAPSGRAYRYVMVTEFGDLNGRLHYHALLHEKAGPILYRDICDSWNGGFAQAKLVDCSTDRGVLGAASYVSKYIAKSASRLRASENYGAIVTTPEEALPTRSVW